MILTLRLSGFGRLLHSMPFDVVKRLAGDEDFHESGLGTGHGIREVLRNLLPFRVPVDGGHEILDLLGQFVLLVGKRRPGGFQGLLLTLH